jgi:GTPase SAR1 family protein
MQKIAVIGTHAVGKTTLCKGLVDYAKASGKKAVCVEEQVRGCPYPIHYGQGTEATEWVMFNQILEERVAAQRKPDLIICDRSALDPIIYYEAAEPEFSENSTLDIYVALRNLAIAHLATYHLIVLVEPIEYTIEPDGFRNTNPIYRKKINDIFVDTLRDINDDMNDPEAEEVKMLLPVYIVDSKSIFEKLDEFVPKIYQRLEQKV